MGSILIAMKAEKFSLHFGGHGQHLSFSLKMGFFLTIPRKLKNIKQVPPH